ncbi:MAG TPA: hypothetical protein VKU60_19765 [Chloroflexota bacterium]|nr:hypothetical protein [Chloroflexota bacterium]
MRAFLTAIISILALAIGILHLALNFVLFHGSLFTNPPPPPGVRLPPGGMPSALPVPVIGQSLPALFTANLIAAVVLVVLLLAGLRAPYWYRLGIDVLLVAFASATLVGWNNIHRPNPVGLGRIAVALEVALIVFALIHLAMTARRPVQRPAVPFPASEPIREPVRGGRAEIPD